MTRSLRPLFLLSLIFAASLLGAADARAETVVLTSGAVATAGDVAQIQNVGGQGFTLNSTTIGPYQPAGCTTAQPCAPGQLVTSAGGTLAVGFTGSPATATLGGVQYNNLALQGTTLNLSLGPFTLPNLPPSSSLQSYTLVIPFTMTGTIVASEFVNSQTAGQQLFTLDVSGSGVAHIQFVQQGTSVSIVGGGFFFQPQPTPEPATLLLFATGAAGLAARLRRRGRRA